ncbi:MAG: ABC transporter permease, partial [Opitutales bacterium]
MPGLVLTNLRRHLIRSLFAVVGIAFGVAAMLTVLSVVLGAIGMFRNILDSDSHYLVFERNVSDLFFSSVPELAWTEIGDMPEVRRANPVLFGIVSMPNHPVITCFGVSGDNPRLVDAEWLAGRVEDYGKVADGVFLGERAAEFMEAHKGDRIEIGKGSFEVVGIIKTKNGFEDGGVFMPLALAQDYFHREGLASIISVNLRDTDQGEAFV